MKGNKRRDKLVEKTFCDLRFSPLQPFIAFSVTSMPVEAHMMCTGRIDITHMSLCKMTLLPPEPHPPSNENVYFPYFGYSLEFSHMSSNIHIRRLFDGLFGTRTKVNNKTRGRMKLCDWVWRKGVGAAGLWCCEVWLQCRLWGRQNPHLCFLQAPGQLSGALCSEELNLTPAEDGENSPLEEVPRMVGGAVKEAIALQPPPSVNKQGELMCHCSFTLHGWQEIQEEKWEKRGGGEKDLFQL